MIEINKNKIANSITKFSEEFEYIPKHTISTDNYFKHLEEIILILNNIEDGAKILDIGGGMGVNISVMSMMNINAEYHLIDRFDEYINGTIMGKFNDSAIKRFERYNINIKSNDILKNLVLPYEDDYFDFVTCIDVIEHLPVNPLGLFKEIRRVVKKGGYFLLSSPNLFGLSETFKFLRGKHPYMDFDIWIKDKYYSHFREYTLKEHIKLLELSGFKIVRKHKSAEAYRKKYYFGISKSNYLKYTISYIILKFLIFLRPSVYVLARN